MTQVNKAYCLLLLLSIIFLFYAESAIAQKIKMTKLSDNVYQHISYKEIAPWGLVGASGLVVINGNNAFIIDTPWTNTETKQLIEWIKAKGLTLSGAVVTHFHEDASGGIPLLNKLKISTYATPLTNSLLKLNQKEIANNEISTNPFVLIEEVVTIFYPGAGHTKDNIVVWLNNEKILFGGCFVKSLHAKNLGNTEDAVLGECVTSINNVITQYPDIDIVVPGHGAIGDTNLLKHTQHLVLSK